MTQITATVRPSYATFEIPGQIETRDPDLLKQHQQAVRQAEADLEAGRQAVLDGMANSPEAKAVEGMRKRLAGVDRKIRELTLRAEKAAEAFHSAVDEDADFTQHGKDNLLARQGIIQLQAVRDQLQGRLDELQKQYQAAETADLEEWRRKRIAVIEAGLTESRQALEQAVVTQGLEIAAAEDALSTLRHGVYTSHLPGGAVDTSANWTSTPATPSPVWVPDFSTLTASAQADDKAKAAYKAEQSRKAEEAAEGRARAMRDAEHAQEISERQVRDLYGVQAG
jgi:hypothetical protein